MVNLSLRRLDDETATRLKTEAGLHDMSVNAFLLRLIRQQLDLTPSHPTPRQYHDLDHLAGTWSEAEADLFLQDLADFAVIDPELWR